MTMLTHIHTPRERAAYSLARPDTIASGATRARIAAIKRACWSAVMILLAGGALTGIVALKASVYFRRYH
jgi:hypothetical protein